MVFVLRRDQPKASTVLNRKVSMTPSERMGSRCCSSTWTSPRKRMSLSDQNHTRPNATPHALRYHQQAPPPRSTLTTSMVNHWLHDVLADDERLAFVTRQCKLGKPHTPDDRLHLHTQMVEVMDDFILLMPSINATYTSALHAKLHTAGD